MCALNTSDTGSKISQVIFDLGNVLIDIHPRRAMSLLVEHATNKLDDPLTLFDDAVHHAYMAGGYSPMEYFHHFNQKLELNIDFTEFTLIWKQLIGQPKPGITELVEELRGRYTLHVLSNTDPLHWEQALVNCPFLSHFELFFLSFEIGHNKPGTEIYDTVLERVDLPASHLLFIDDSEANISTAAQLGFHVVHARENEQTVEDVREMLAANGFSG